MTRRKVSTFKELWEQSGPQWNEMPEGLRLIVSEEPVHATRNRLEVRLTPAAAAAFHLRPREKLVARVAGGRLIIERPESTPRKRANRG